MSLMMTKCPVTGKAVSTAIEAEASSFRRLPKVTAHMRCPACGQQQEAGALECPECGLAFFAEGE